MCPHAAERLSLPENGSPKPKERILVRHYPKATIARNNRFLRPPALEKLTSDSVCHFCTFKQKQPSVRVHVHLSAFSKHPMASTPVGLTVPSTGGVKKPRGQTHVPHETKTHVKMMQHYRVWGPTKRYRASLCSLHGNLAPKSSNNRNILRMEGSKSSGLVTRWRVPFRFTKLRACYHWMPLCVGRSVHGTCPISTLTISQIGLHLPDTLSSNPL